MHFGHSAFARRCAELRGFAAEFRSTVEQTVGENPIGKALALRPDIPVNNTDDDIFSGSCMRSCAGRTAQLLPNSARRIQA
jgi:hypothetical protein